MKTSLRLDPHGENLLDNWRRKKGMTCAQLAEKLDVSTYSAWRYCQRRIDVNYQTPAPDVMRRIEEITEGEVTASDMLPHPQRSVNRRAARESAA